MPDGSLATSRVLQSLRLLEKDLDVIESNPEADRLMEENIRRMEEEKRLQLKVSSDIYSHLSVTITVT